jgi:glycolate oxidase
MKSEPKKLNKIYEIDASGESGKAGEVVFPENIDEAKEIVKKYKKISIRAGGTGLVGGAVPQNDEIILDVSKLVKIENLDKGKMTIEVEAGVILDDLQNYLDKYGLEFPINPSSHSVCTIGGMIATDAVGSRAIKYGKTSKWVRWVDVVDGEGNLSRKGITEISDYFGMEGITGVIVKACLKVEEKRTRSAELIKTRDVSELIEIVKNYKRKPEVSMIEFIDRKVSKGIGLEDYYHLIVEYENNLGVLKDKEYEKLLNLRDKIYPFVANEGYRRIEDPKILIEKFDQLLQWLEVRGIPIFGHISVGIFHPCFNDEQKKYIPEMMDMVKRLGGQISGEHGIGILKREFVEPNDKKIIANIKKRTDPSGKFNSGKVI